MDCGVILWVFCGVLKGDLDVGDREGDRGDREVKLGSGKCLLWWVLKCRSLASSERVPGR